MEGRKVTDRSFNISMGCMVAYGLWGVTAVLVLGGIAFDSLHTENIALVLSAAAATATVRCYFVNQNRMMRNVFELGRDTAREDAAVRSLHR